MRQSICLVVGCLAPLVGCAGNAPPPPFRPVAQIIQRQAGISTDRPDRVAGPVTPPADWLIKPLDADAAVRIALVCNRRLAAAYDQLDVSQSDLVQAGLLKNPVLDLSVRLPDRSPRKTYLDFGVSDSLVDLLLIGARRKLAAAELTQAQAMTAHLILQTVADVRSAYFAAVAAEQDQRLRQTIVDAARAADLTAAQIRQAGNIAPIESLRTHAAALKAQSEELEARSQVALTRQKLSALMGIEDQTHWTLADHLPQAPAAESEAGMDQLALRQRQDLQAARQSVVTAAGRLGIVADTRFFGDTTVGPEAERETDGQWRIGPSVSVPIPLFDQGQAAIARAKASLQQSADDYQALRIDVLTQVSSAIARLETARVTATLYRDEILPTQAQVLEQTQRRYNGMYDSVFVLLQAKQTQIDDAIHYVDALRDFWTASAELDAAVGGRLSAAIPEPATLPATQPADKNMDDMEMENMDMENMDMDLKH